MTNYAGVVVPAVPPRPPQVTLLGSAVRATEGSDPGGMIFEVSGDQLAMLPGEMRAELQARRGDAWVRGITYQPESHAAAETRDRCLTAGEGGTVLAEAEENLSIVTFVPYLVATRDRCSAFGWSEHDYKGRAERLCDNATPRAVENEFWTGAIAQEQGYPNNYLQNAASATDLTPGTVPSIARGMQILQDGLQQCGFGGQGMIHVQAQTAPNLLGARRIGPLMYDIFDNLVVPGVGYTGNGPVGNSHEKATGEEAWMFATDLVFCRQSDITVFPDSFAEAFDRGQGGNPNTVTFYAERFAAGYFDAGCHFACRVKLAT